jgi:hypothetical protein
MCAALRTPLALRPSAQEQERAHRQGHVAILVVALAGADVQEHPSGVNVGDFQAQTFAQAQATGVDICMALLLDVDRRSQRRRVCRPAVNDSRAKEKQSNHPPNAKPPEHPFPPPRSGFVQPFTGANAERPPPFQSSALGPAWLRSAFAPEWTRGAKASKRG